MLDVTVNGVGGTVCATSVDLEASTADVKSAVCQRTGFDPKTVRLFCGQRELVGGSGCGRLRDLIAEPIEGAVALTLVKRTTEQVAWLESAKMALKQSCAGTWLQTAPVGATGDREVMLMVVAQDAQALQYAEPELKGDREIVMKAVAQNGLALQYASLDLLGDRAVVLKALAQNGFAMHYVSEELRGDREFILEAVATRGQTLSYASKVLKADREVVLTAVAQDGCALRCASDELKGDHEVVLAAVAKAGDAALFWAAPHIKHLLRQGG